MRKLTITSKYSCDLLVFDTIGLNWISSCVPDNLSVEFLDIRKYLPFFYNPSFASNLVVNAIKTYFSKEQFRSGFYLASLLDQIKPKIILTCSDMDMSLAKYAESHPDTVVIYIQNALRDTKYSIPPDIRLPNYFAFGQVEKEIFRIKDISYENYIPIGSLKLEVALRTFKESPTSGSDIAFISHYRPELLSPSSLEINRKIDEVQRYLFSHTCAYANERNFSLSVISKTRDEALQNEELRYFQDLSDNYNFEFVSADKQSKEFDTYYAALSSELVVHPASTLGFEVFSAGKKVLFGATIVDELVTDWGIEEYFRYLPSFVTPINNSFQEYCTKADHLMAMPNHVYQGHTRQAVDYCMKDIQTSPPSRIIKNFIQQCLSESL